MSNPRTFPVVLVRDEDGMFAADCPILPGCFSQGATRDEALANIREAIELTLECQPSEGWVLPDDYELTSIPVPLAA
jgi:predicted RNase H-like HicB family nuclease